MIQYIYTFNENIYFHVTVQPLLIRTSNLVDRLSINDHVVTMDEIFELCVTTFTSEYRVTIRNRFCPDREETTQVKVIFHLTYFLLVIEQERHEKISRISCELPVQIRPKN